MSFPVPDDAETGGLRPRGRPDLVAVPGLGDGPAYRPATFEEYLVSIGLKANTVRNYLWRLGKAERVCDELGVTLLEADARDLAAVAMAGPGSHAYRAQMRCALKHWYEWQDRSDPPIRAVRVPPQPKMVNRALDPDAARRLVATARGWWPAGGAVLLGVYLALRRFEIAISQWERFSEDMAWYTVTGKRDKTATLPVHPVLADELAPHRQPSGHLFPGRFGSHVTPATIWEWTHKVGETAGISHLVPHELRHTSLTTALDNTENLRSVMEFARHERPQTTAGYTRTTKEQLLRVSEALDFTATTDVGPEVDE